jgi:hypothetical protein
VNSISSGVFDVSPALEAVRLALASLSPIEAAALALGWVGFFVAVVGFSRRPVVTLNERNAAEVTREVTR